MTEVARVMRELNSFVAGVVRLIAVNVTKDIVKSTPVDTGFAKANWIPSVGAPRSSPSGSRDSVSSGAQSTGLARVRAYQAGQGRVFIVNNVSYIGDLNNGTSAQAPAGFVQGGIIRGVSKAAAVARTLNVRR